VLSLRNTIMGGINLNLRVNIQIAMSLNVERKNQNIDFMDFYVTQSLLIEDIKFVF
jgi:hypothetical protein